MAKKPARGKAKKYKATAKKAQFVGVVQLKLYDVDPVDRTCSFAPVKRTCESGCATF